MSQNKKVSGGKKTKRKQTEAPSSSSEDEGYEPSVVKTEHEEQDASGHGGKKKAGTFMTMGLLSPLVKAIQKKGFRLPTPIQRKCIPPLLGGRDVVGMARTGSGKTAAFVLPLLNRLRAHSVKVGIRALILSPSRELALQTYSVVKELSKFTDLRSIVLVGGDGLEEQFSHLATNPDIVVATPGRLVHLCVETGMSLKEVEMVVWDEADRLMEDPVMAGQMREISARLPEARQTALFSATLPKALAEFAQAGLKDPLLVRLDTETKLSPDLKISFLHLQSGSRDAMLLLLLDKVIRPLSTSSSTSTSTSNSSSSGQQLQQPQLTVIFTATKHHVEYLQELLTAFGFSCAYIYGNLDQVARQHALDSFRRGRKPILIVTDLAARGIDIPLLDNVINYDFPPTAKLFVHRVGRVARAGRSGTAYSFVTPDELPYLFDLQLFLSKSVVSSLSTTDDGHGGDLDGVMVLGGAPQTLLDEQEEAIRLKVSMSGSISSLKDVMTNAYKLYRRTRPAPSPESHRRSKEFVESCHNAYGVHPIFHQGTGHGKVIVEQAQMISAIHQYKPKATHLALPPPGLIAKKAAAPNTSNAEPSKPSETRKRTSSSNGGRDEEHYLKYRKEGGQDEAGYSITGGSFAEAARKAIFDMNATTLISDEPSGNKNGSKRQIGSNNEKYIKTEHGTRVPASFKSEMYDKWRAKTHLDLQSVGEMENEASAKRARDILTGQAEKKHWRNRRLATATNNKPGKKHQKHHSGVVKKHPGKKGAPAMKRSGRK